MRTVVRLALVIASTALPAVGSAQTQTPPALPVFDFPQSGVTFQTGDSWSTNGQAFRLYGVQSCIRGTFFTNSAKVRTDCGEVSLAYRGLWSASDLPHPSMILMNAARAARPQ